MQTITFVFLHSRQTPFSAFCCFCNQFALILYWAFKWVQMVCTIPPPLQICTRITNAVCAHAHSHILFSVRLQRPFLLFVYCIFFLCVLLIECIFFYINKIALVRFVFITKPLGHLTWSLFSIHIDWIIIIVNCNTCRFLLCFKHIIESKFHIFLRPSKISGQKYFPSNI